MHSDFGGLGRYAEPWLLVLTSLSDGPKHGYAIMADVAAFSGVRMEPGALYGALSRLERRGWVQPLADGSAAAGTRSPAPGHAGQARAVRWSCPPAKAGHARPSWLTGPHRIHYNLVSGTEEREDTHAREVR